MTTHLNISLGDVPTWVASVGTVGALIAALVQINTERNRRHANEERERYERHRSQAQLISAIMGPEEKPPSQEELPFTPLKYTHGRTGVDIINNSAEPVYSVVVGIVFLRDTTAGPRTTEEALRLRREMRLPGMPVTTTSILPPGTYRVWVREVGWARRPGAEIAFTDRAGNHWIRRTDGQLEELAKPPFEYFSEHGMYGPYELQLPERL